VSREQTRTGLSALLAFLFFVFLQSAAPAEVDNFYFFPKPPSYNAKDYIGEIAGTLDDFDYGRRSCAMTIRIANGDRHSYYIAKRGSVLLDGKPTDCFESPGPSASKRSGVRPYTCATWPRSIVAKRTKVYLEVFLASYHSQSIPVVGIVSLYPLRVTEERSQDFDMGKLESIKSD
jgi:hypothetical protein